MIEADATADAAAESVLDEFVDYFNARDFDGLATLVDDDATVPMFPESGKIGAISGFADLALRNPGLVFTRGELGEEPVAVAWSPAPGHEYRRMGYLAFTFTETDGETLIEHAVYDDQPEGVDGVLAEEPDPEDMGEGDTWEEWDSGAA